MTIFASGNSNVEEQINQIEGRGGNNHAKKQSSNLVRQDSDSILNGFVDLMNQVSSFHMGKLSGRPSFIFPNEVDPCLKEITDN